MKKYRLVTYKKECQGVPTDWASLNALKITMEEHPEENCIYVIEEIECCGMPKFERNHSDNIKDTYFCHLTADDIEEMYEKVQKGVGKFLIRIREVKE